MSIAITTFSTADLPPEDRHEAWLRQGWPHVSAVLDATPTEPFDTGSSRYALGKVVVQASAMTAQDYARSRTLIDADGVDRLFALFPIEGRMAGNAAGRSFAVGPGEILLLDMATPHVHSSTASRTLLVTVPRTALLMRGIDPRRVHGTAIGAQEAALVTAYVGAMTARVSTIRPSRAAMLGRMVLDLIEVGLEDAGLIAEAGPGAAATEHMLAARAHIEAHLAAADLDAASVAAAIGVSRSALYRMFADTGGVASFIRQRRLDRVRQAIASGAPGTLAELAAPWGFTDASHLGRLFRARYGMTPGDYRESLAGE